MHKQDYYVLERVSAHCDSERLTPTRRLLQHRTVGVPVEDATCLPPARLHGVGALVSGQPWRR